MPAHQGIKNTVWICGSTCVWLQHFSRENCSPFYVVSCDNIAWFHGRSPPNEVRSEKIWFWLCFSLLSGKGRSELQMGEEGRFWVGWRAFLWMTSCQFGAEVSPHFWRNIILANFGEHAFVHTWAWLNFADQQGSRLYRGGQGHEILRWRICNLILNYFDLSENINRSTILGWGSNDWGRFVLG